MKNFYYILVCAVWHLSCAPGAYIASDFHREILNTTPIAILPYQIIISSEAKKPNLPEETIKMIDQAEIISFQRTLFLHVREYDHTSKYNWMDPDQVNQLLRNQGIDIYNWRTHTPEQILKDIQVDAILIPILHKTGYRTQLPIAGQTTPDLNGDAPTAPSTLELILIHKSDKNRKWQAKVKGNVNWNLPPGLTLQELHAQVIKQWPK